MSQPLHVIILAAGEGKRMRSSRPKVLQPIAGQPMLAQVIAAARALDPATPELPAFAERLGNARR